MFPKIPLGDEEVDVVALNYHDCIDRHMFWFQDGIRSLEGKFSGKTVSLIDAANSQRDPAFWPVKIAADGEYVIELRRWPVELDRPIHADLPSGELVYGAKSHRSQAGRGFPAVNANLTIGDQQLTTTVNEQAKAAVFHTKLTAGSHRLSAKFSVAAASSTI